jgi:hypothetical protein
MGHIGAEAATYDAIPAALVISVELLSYKVGDCSMHITTADCQSKSCSGCCNSVARPILTHVFCENTVRLHLFSLSLCRCLLASLFVGHLGQISTLSRCLLPFLSRHGFPPTRWASVNNLPFLTCFSLFFFVLFVFRSKNTLCTISPSTNGEARPSDKEALVAMEVSGELRLMQLVTYHLKQGNRNRSPPRIKRTRLSRNLSRNYEHSNKTNIYLTTCHSALT